MMGKYGKKSRSFMDEFNVRYTVSLQRFRCAGCQTIYTEWPDCFEKGKRYLHGVIIGVQNGCAERNTGPSRTTAWRWRKEKKVTNPE